MAENRRLAAPASVGSLPTSAMQEDHVSMGWAAARKLRTSLRNLGRILAVELTCAAHGLDLRAPLQPGPGGAAALGAVRARIAGPGRRPPAGARPRRGRGARRRRRGAGRGRGGRGGDGVSREVRAPHGTELSCKGWPQEAALRMLMNNLDPDVAERPDDLVVYGGTGRAARSWEAFDAIVASLRDLEGDETLLVQSGKPVGVMRTHEWAPRVLIANSNLVPGVGDVGRVPPPRGPRADDVRPDDRRLVDLHRHPGHRAGHLRVLRRDRAAPPRRLAGRHDHADRRARRDGRRAAAGGDDERRRRAVRRGRPAPHPAAPGDALPRRAGRRPRRRGRALPRRAGRRARAQRRARGQRRRGAAARCSTPASRPTSSPTRRARTTRSAATCRTA